MLSFGIAQVETTVLDILTLLPLLCEIGSFIFLVSSFSSSPKINLVVQTGWGCPVPGSVQRQIGQGNLV